MKWKLSWRRRERPPKIQNLFLYAYGCLAKLVGLLLFAAVAFVTALALLAVRLFCRVASGRRGKTRARLSRRLIALSCRLFVFLLRGIRFMRVKVSDADRQGCRTLASCIVVANHPSILDLPLLLSLVPAASLVAVRSGRRPFLLSFVRWLVADLFVVAPSWGGLCGGCREALLAGGNIIVFPERRLTPRGGTNPYRRTAARLARECACGIQPLYIGGSDKYGLGSPAAPFAYCRTGLYLYELKLLPPISGGEYAEMQAREASVAVTKKIHDEISAEAYLSDYRIV